MLGTKGHIDILGKTGTLMKLTKNLVTIPSSLWTRYLIKISISLH